MKRASVATDFLRLLSLILKYNTGETDFERIEKALKFKPELNYEAVFSSPVAIARAKVQI